MKRYVLLQAKRKIISSYIVNRQSKLTSHEQFICLDKYDRITKIILEKKNVHQSIYHFKIYLA